ncbi:hypothetical protein [Mycobacterium simiae]|uniref:hypothetical protein n=1 Tax=Mycobacterium simiae TaxID=1784 RepID=UPI0026123653|nr:hypothetical protein [Mycobacterium simiae]
MGLISSVLKSDGCAVALLDVAGDDDAAELDEVDDFADDEGPAALSPPHPCSAAPTTKVVAARAAADNRFTMDSSARR